MNQSELLSHIVVRVVQSPLWAMSKKDALQARNLARLNQKYGEFFDGLNQGFGGVANTIKEFSIVAARGLSWRYI